MAFPYDSEGRPNTEQAILAGVAGVSASGDGFLRVSSIDSTDVVFSGDAANNRVSAIQEGAGALMVSAKSQDGALMRVSAVQDGAAALNVSAKSNSANLFRVSAFSDDAGLLRVSSLGGTSSPLSADSSSVSAKQGDAANLNVSAKSDSAATFRVSAFSGDAALLRMSAIGGTAGDNVIVDGVTQSISATLTPISANPATTIAGIVVHANQPDAGRLLISAKQGDGALLRVSAVQDGAAALNVSAKSDSAALFRVSAFSGDSGTLLVSAKSPDAGTFLISAKQGDAGLLLTSAKQGDAGLLLISAKQGDGALFRTSAVQDGAAALNVSAKSNDAGTLLTSAKQGDASLLRVSSFGSVVTVNTGGASFFSTSAGIAQTSAIKQSAGRLYGYHLTHGAGVDQYLLVFNASATSAVTLGTTVPDLYLGVPSGTGANAGSGAVHYFDQGIAMSNGITIAVVSAINGTTAGASAMRVNLFYA